MSSIAYQLTVCSSFAFSKAVLPLLTHFYGLSAFLLPFQQSLHTVPANEQHINGVLAASVHCQGFSCSFCSRSVPLRRPVFSVSSAPLRKQPLHHLRFNIFRVIIQIYHLFFILRSIAAAVTSPNVL